MNLSDYRKKKPLYNKFAKHIGNILAKAIREASNNGSHTYSVQQITTRAKNIKSLEKKIKNGNTQNLERINDLAGCRIIFYHNNDINAFTRSRIIENSFKQIGYNIHVPCNPKAVNDYYTARHYIVKLKKENLPKEFEEFKNLKCEIQIQTTLTHAWSETAHDITYKKNQTPGFGNKIEKSIEERMIGIMKQYLIPAGYEFQKIKDDYKRLQKGQRILNLDLKEEVNTCHNTNSLHHILESLYNSLEDCDREYLENNIDPIIEIAVAAFEQSFDKKQVSIDPWGYLEGKKPKDILELSLKVLQHLQYFDIEKVFHCHLSFIKKSQPKEEKNLILKSINEISKYNWNIIKNEGFPIQEKLLSYIENLDDKSFIQAQDPVITVCKNILSFYAQGVETKGETTILTQANIESIPETKNLKDRALTLLEKLYNQSEKNSQNYKLLEEIEKASGFLLRAKENETFNIYKVLTGSESIFYKFQENREQDPEELRKQEVEQLVQEIQKKWKEIIITSIKAIQEIRERHQYLHTSLKIITKERPDFVFDLLKQYENELTSFLSPILDELLNSNKEQETKRIIDDWINNGKNLYACIYSLNNKELLTKELICKIFEKSKVSNETDTVCLINSIVSNNFGAYDLTFSKQLIKDTIEYLTEQKNIQWIFSFCHGKTLHDLIQKLGEEVDFILSSLIFLNDRDHYQLYIVENILTAIGKSSPKKVLRFFKDKLLEKDQHGNIIDPYGMFFYDLSFSKLRKELLNYNETFDTIEKWYVDDSTLPTESGSKLIHKIFPEITQELKKKLIALAKRKENTNFSLVISILKQYQGNAMINDICKAIIERLPQKSKYLPQIEAVLQPTGIFSGSDGIIDAYRKKSEEISPWKSDSSPKVKRFAKNFIHGMTNFIKTESQRKEEEIALRGF